MVIVIADKTGKALREIADYSLEVAFGEDENTITITADADVMPPNGGYAYIDGTEYGGTIDKIKSGTTIDTLSGTGRSWHGVLAGKRIVPASGQSHVIASGQVSTVLQQIIDMIGLSELFEAPSAESDQVTISNYQFERFVDAYTGLKALCLAYGLKLTMRFASNKVLLGAKAVVDYGSKVDSDLLDFDITVTSRCTNHLICGGTGENENRAIVHFYADAEGNVSYTQTLFGVDEIVGFYDYSNADEAQLEEDGKKKLEELQTEGEVQVSVHDDLDIDVGDIVTGRDNRTGMIVSAPITKKIVKVDRGVATYSYEAGTPSSGTSASTISGSAESTNGGHAYYAGNGLSLDNYTFDADVNASDLQAVSNTASNALTQASSALSNASAAQQTADGKADAVHTHAAADTTSGVFDLDRIPTIPASKLSGTLDIAGGGTGANNAANAANNLEVYYLGVREPIPTNADLNNYKTVGSYASPSNSMAATVINAPMDTPRAFILTVEKTIANESTANYFRQIFHDRTGKIYTRFIEGDTWSDWIKIANETDLDNYLPLTGGTLKGNVNINRGTSESNIQLIRTIEDKQVASYLLTNSLGQTALRCYETKDGSSTLLNELKLLSSETTLAKPLTVSSGGTGANTAEQARENLGAASEDHTHNYAGSSRPGGAATSASKLATARTITLTGAVNGSATFDGSENITITTTGDSEAASFLAAHPVGAIYHTTKSDNPSTVYGGIWQALPSIEGFMWERTA